MPSQYEEDGVQQYIALKSKLTSKHLYGIAATSLIISIIWIKIEFIVLQVLAD
jgi:hypothetical protein